MLKAKIRTKINVPKGIKTRQMLNVTHRISNYDERKPQSLSTVIDTKSLYLKYHPREATTIPTLS